MSMTAGAGRATTPRAARRIWLGCALLAAPLLATTALWVPRSASWTQLWQAAALTAVVAICERWVSITVRTGTQSHSLTLSEAPLLIGLFLLPVPLLVGARITGMVVANQVLRRQEGYKTALNVTQTWTETLIAAGLTAVVTGLALGVHVELLVAAAVVGLVVNIVGVAFMTVAVSSTAGHLVLGPARRAVWTGLVPAITSALVGAAAVALWAVSPVLVLGPAMLSVVLTVAYRSWLELVEANASHARLLTFTKAVAAAGDLDATIDTIVKETRTLLSPRHVAVRLPRSSDEPAAWVGVDAATAAELDLLLEHDGDAGATVPPADEETLFVPLDTGWIAVSLERDSIRPHDRRTVGMLATHATVVVQNIRSADSLRDQAEEARHRASHDALTGLPNRQSLLTAIVEADLRGHAFGVLLLDLNDFRKVNDALGHDAGDQVLTELTRRVAPIAEDVRVFARLGGDEFAAVVEGDVSRCTLVAERLHLLIGRTTSVGGYDVATSASIGVALAPEHGSDPSTLLKHAELAMYAAKQRGCGTHVYGIESGGRALRDLKVSSGFRMALDRGEIDVVFQPIIDLDTGRVAAVEALTRWSHPELGVIRPDEFIVAAEQNGMVTDLTRHVLHASLQWQRLWAAAGIDLQVAVNISARSLVDDRLADMVSGALSRHRVPANRLTLELTESSVVSDPSITIATLRRLRTLGVRLAVDDFGTGYSSLAYLRELPVDEVKIDKSFVIPLVDELHTPPLLSGIINLCREMGFELVGEGIENATVQRKLTDMGCSRGQGFHIARPMDGADLLEWQARWHDDRHLSIVL